MKQLKCMAALAIMGHGPSLAQGESPHSHVPASAPSAAILAEGEPGQHGGTHAHHDTLVPERPTLLDGYGSGGFTITTRVPEAQAFFSNALELGAAFAHPAAVAAAKHAVLLDPACGMCKWGEALADGPTINYGKYARERVPLLRLAQEGERQVQVSGTARERALAAAMVTRYRPGDIRARDRDYAAAMLKVQAAYPQDNEIAVLTADAIMQIALTSDEIDRPRLAPAVALLEEVLKRDPDHTPAIHFYIHATETIGQGFKAEPYANRLAALAPKASHLVHMPSHTFYWVGRYQDAADANRAAVEIGKAQAKVLGVKTPEGVWGLPYHAHNVIFGMGGALMANDSRTALDLARPIVEAVQSREQDEPRAQLLAAVGYYAIVRFDPASVAALPEPKLPYLKAAWHYARGEAAAWQGDVAALRAEREAIPATLVNGKPVEEASHSTGELTKGDYAASRGRGAAEQMLGIMRHVLDGRAALSEGRPAEAAKAFTAAAEIEETGDFNRFADPPAFWYPVRRDVAAAKLAAGDAAGAVAAAEASLKLRPLDPVAKDILAKAKAAPWPR